MHLRCESSSVVVSGDLIHWFTAYQTYGTRNAPLASSAQSRACIPAQARAYGVLAVTILARRLFVTRKLD